MPALRMTLNAPTEREEQQALFSIIERKATVYPVLRSVYHIPNGAFLGAGRLRMGAILRAMGVRPGVPDIHCPVPSFPYASLYIELKRLDASPSDTKPEQRAWHTLLRENGHRVEVCKGWRAAWNILCDYLYLDGEQVK